MDAARGVRSSLARVQIQKIQEEESAPVTTANIMYYSFRRALEF